MAIKESNIGNVVNINYSEENNQLSDESFTPSIPHTQSVMNNLDSDSQVIVKSTSNNIFKGTNASTDFNFNLDSQDNGCKNNKNITTPNKMLENSPKSNEYEILNEPFHYNQSPPQPSKLKMKCTKRRAGVLYKKLMNSKMCKVTSRYFNQEVSAQKRWIPPRSPYALVQEDLFDKPWQLLVATVFLTKTAAKRALPQLHKFLARFPRPEDVLQANYEDIDEYFKPLGLTNTRSHTIMRFTVEFLEKDWTYPRELYGIGKYGDDSYRMFCINEWRQVSPDDIPLTMYRNWLLENADRLGIT